MQRSIHCALHADDTSTEEKSADKQASSSEPRPAVDRQQQQSIEDELRDPKNFVEYFLPRPLRLTFFAGAALSCFIALALAASRAGRSLPAAAADGSLRDLGLNATGAVVFLALFAWDWGRQTRRRAQRAELRQKQIEFGDRCVASRELIELKLKVHLMRCMGFVPDLRSLHSPVPWLPLCASRDNETCPDASLMQPRAAEHGC